MPKKRLLLFSALVILSFVLMTYQIKKGTISPFKLIRYPINIANDTVSSICLKTKGIFRKIRLRDEENRRLTDELNNLLMEQQRYKEALLENTRLREMLSLKEKEKRYVATARVIARGSDRWSHTLVINKGKHNGIEKDMAVITPRGLVGKILSTADSFSYILLVNDINFSAAVRLHESRTEGIISGTGSKTCILKYVQQEYPIIENEMVITSGLDSVFPADIPVGFVTKITKKGEGLFQNIEITPFHDSKRLEEVMIVRR